MITYCTDYVGHWVGVLVGGHDYSLPEMTYSAALTTYAPAISIIRELNVLDLPLPN